MHYDATGACIVQRWTGPGILVFEWSDSHNVHSHNVHKVVCEVEQW